MLSRQNNTLPLGQIEAPVLSAWLKPAAKANYSTPKPNSTQLPHSPEALMLSRQNDTLPLGQIEAAAATIASLLLLLLLLLLLHLFLRQA
jgi:hypothetical protein